MIALLTPLLAPILALTPGVRADSWLPYANRRVVDPTGTWYVVVRAHDPTGFRGASWELRRAAPGSPAVEPAQESPPSWLNESPDSETVGPVDIGPRAGDERIAAGDLEDTPYAVLVSATGLGFCAIEKYGMLGHGTSLAIVGPEGLRHRYELSDLLTAEEIGDALHTASSIHWYAGGWIDEKRREVVLAGASRLLAVSFETGAVRTAGEPEIDSALASRSDRAAQRLALDLVPARRADALTPQLTEIARDESAPLANRMRAIILLARAGSDEGRELVLNAARIPRPADVSAEDHTWAVEHLRSILGAEAIPLLLEALRSEDDGDWSAAMDGLVGLGVTAVPALVVALADTDQSANYRGGAAHALGGIGARTSLDPLVAAIADTDEYVANAAANAAIEIGGRRIAGELVRVLERGTTQDGRIALYFEDVRYPAALPALRRALERHDPESTDHAWIRDAIAFQESR